MEKKIKNEETKVPATISLNDRDYLTDILSSEKHMNVDMAIALNEASNDELYEKLYEFSGEIKQAQRKLYNLAFQKGWYTLEEVPQKKIDEKYNSLIKKYDELNDCDCDEEA